jgi:hypothetical protein
MVHLCFFRIAFGLELLIEVQDYLHLLCKSFAGAAHIVDLSHAGLLELLVHLEVLYASETSIAYQTS